MADNLQTQDTTPATLPDNTKVATRSVTYSGDTDEHIAPVGIVAFSGADDAKVATDITGDGANGLDVDVTRLPALPAGSNNIGDVDVLTLPALPAGTNNIGDVDIVSMPTVTVAEPVTVDATDGTFFARSASASTFPVNVGRVGGNVTAVGSGTVDTGTQRVTLATDVALPAGTNNIGDVDVLTLPALPAGNNNIGDVDVASSALPTGAATSANQSTEITALQLIDDAVHTDDQARSKSLLIGAVLDDTSPTAITENQAGYLRMSSARRLLVDGSGTTQPVSGTVSINAIPAGSNNIGDVDVLTLPALPAGTNNIGDVDVLSLPALPSGTNNIGDVDVLTLPALPAGSNNIGDVDVLSGPTGSSALQSQGAAANDAAVAGNPVWVAGRTSTAIPGDAGADGDAKGLWVNRQGLVMVSTAPHLGLFGSQPWNLTSKTARYTSTQTSTVLQAGGASERIVVTSYQIQAGGTVAGEVILYFGTGAYSRGTNLAIFDGEFAPSATVKPGAIQQGPFISATNGDDVLVTTSAALNPLTITIWYYIVT